MSGELDGHGFGGFGGCIARGGWKRRSGGAAPCVARHGETARPAFLWYIQFLSAEGGTVHTDTENVEMYWRKGSWNSSTWERTDDLCATSV